MPTILLRIILNKLGCSVRLLKKNFQCGFEIIITYLSFMGPLLY